MEPPDSHRAIGDQPVSTTPSAWRPLHAPTFRNLLIANVFSDVGAFMQSVGAAWLMISLKAGPMYVALTQTASALPFFLFSLPAGALGDIVDRRKLILWTEIWMAAMAGALAALVIMGWMSPWLLLAFTFAISAGDAFEAPTWRAVLPDLVAKEDFEAASALNGIEFNLARAVGPGLAGLLIAAFGVGTAFVVNAASFIGVIYVLARWKHPHRKRTAPTEKVVGATIAALRYIRYSTLIRSLIIRSGAIMFFASALLALLPTIAHNVSRSPIAFGLLLGCFGIGAILGAIVLPRARARWSIETVVSGAVSIVGIVTVASGFGHELFTLAALMLVGGAAWLTFISLVSATIQKLAPDWVRARVLAVFILVFQGGVAAGSALWGTIAERAGLSTSLLWAGLGAMATTAFGLISRLPDTAIDVTPWNHWRMPCIPDGLEVELDAGPVLVTVEYIVKHEHASEFLRTMRRYERVRRRDGASRWGIYRDTEHPDLYLETFIVHSWAEHLRQHERITRDDSELEERVNRYAAQEPKVRHLIYATTSLQTSGPG